ncbi:exodeoxyribonuclease III [Aerobium aerolatum]|uniref:Exodeoxyribonuclease-3 n=1 Tax=Aquamicrobium aerolatum DSM 21857 TaxID=1121003 RepID=A0A1I3PDN0_9HYPH|nr:exodeoxyribonuclease III [Aquamicrobium aerolatum]SFJ19457.1 exodeoxyribonuclease-3 [Aquamicrobium aerolatum DSM 21857]
MKIVTWNINGVKARIDVLLHWLEESQPDIVCLQEIKSVDEGFPRLEIEAMGYHIETHGQKGFNGVAILSKLRFDEVNRGLPGDDEDEQARFIEGVISTDGGVLRVVSLYLPNGNPITEDRKFGYKLRWMERLERWAAERLALEEPLVLAGDYNVIPQPIDARQPELWVNDALYQPESRGALRRLEYLGFTEAIRTVSDEQMFTFWDYQAGAWQKNNGIRIDHLLLSPEAANRLASASIEKHVRGWEKPSDHVPVAAELAFN